MRVKDRTKELLLKEVAELRQRIVELERTGIERKKEALQGAEEELKTIFDEIRQGIALLDLTGKVTSINKRITETSGHTEKDVVGKHLKRLKMFPPQSIPPMLTAFAQVISGQLLSPYEVELYTKTGEKRIVEIDGTLLRKGGKTERVIAVIRDVTARKQAEGALRESEQKYRTILESMEEGYYEVDLGGNFTFFNEALRKIHGRSRDEMIGMNNREYTTPETAKRIYSIFNKVYRTGIPAKIVDYEIIRKDGSVAMIEESASLLRNAAGEPIGFYGVSRDRTEQKKAEQALRQSEEKYRTILEDIAEGYYEVDLDGNFTFFNDSLCRIYVYTRDELMEMNNRAYMSPETAKKTYRLFNKVYKTGEPSKIFDWEFTKKDGRTITVEISVSLVKDSQGNAVGFRGILRDITARKQAEEAVRQSEESYRNVLALAPDSITISRIEDGRFLQVNDAFCRHTGYTPEEAIGRTASDLNILVDPAARGRLLETLQRHGCAEGLETQFRAKDGTILDDLVSARPIRFQGEDCLLLVATNVNALKEAQQALRESEEKYRTILETMEEGYYEVDLAGNLTFFNEALCRIHGRSRDEMMGLNNRAFSSPETAKRIYAIFNKVYSTGIPAKTIDYDVIRKDGSVALIETSASVLRNVAGEPIGFYGVSRDRTEQKKAEEALRRSEEKYRTILEDIEEGYYEVDLAGNFTLFNDSLCMILRYTRDELMGMNNREYMDKENAKKVYKIFNTVFRTGEGVTIHDWQIIRKDGSKRAVEVSVSLIRNSRGKPKGFRGVIRDITERKRAEEELEYIATHDSLTGLPNRALFNDRLSLALKQADRNKKKLAVMLLDLDYFKNVNDTLGHSIGDQLLRVVGTRLKELLRGGDTVSRVGGDEFLLLLSEIVRIKDANIIAQKILEAFRKPFILDNHEIMITTSIGIAIYPDDGDYADTLTKHADVAMYRAKDKGRDNFQRYKPA